MESGGSLINSQLVCNDAIVARSDVVIEEGSVVIGEGSVVNGEGSVVIGEGSAASEGGDSNMPEPNEFENVAPGNMRNPEEYMPIANILRIMRRALPAQAKVADDAKETVQECVTEFISFITNEANVRCQSECRKTITAEDVLSAMAALGFSDYVQPLCDFMNKYREQDPGRRSSRIGYAPPRMIAPAYYVDHELPPPHVDGGESSSGGPGAMDGSLNSE